MTEYGLFNDEGCVESQIYSLDEANERLGEYDEEDDLYISEVCPHHPGQEADFCEDCEEEDEEFDELLLDDYDEDGEDMMDDDGYDDEGYE